MSKILGGRLQKPISQSLASLVASLSLVPPSFPLYRSRCSRSPLSLSLLIVAIAFSVRTSSQINLITHTQTAWERSTHTHTRTYPGRWHMKLRIRQVGPKTVAKSSELAVCLAGFFIVWGMPQDASATAAQRRRSRLITMQIWSRRMRNICTQSLGECVCECRVCAVLFCFVLFPFAFALTVHTFVRDACQCAVYSFKHFGKLVINIHKPTHTHVYLFVCVFWALHRFYRRPFANFASAVLTIRSHGAAIKSLADSRRPQS